MGEKIEKMKMINSKVFVIILILSFRKLEAKSNLLAERVKKERETHLTVTDTVEQKRKSLSSLFSSVELSRNEVVYGGEKMLLFLSHYATSPSPSSSCSSPTSSPLSPSPLTTLSLSPASSPVVSPPLPRRGDSSDSATAKSPSVSRSRALSVPFNVIHPDIGTPKTPKSQKTNIMTSTLSHFLKRKESASTSTETTPQKSQTRQSTETETPTRRQVGLLSF